MDDVREQSFVNAIQREAQASNLHPIRQAHLLEQCALQQRQTNELMTHQTIIGLGQQKSKILVP